MSDFFALPSGANLGEGNSDAKELSMSKERKGFERRC